MVDKEGYELSRWLVARGFTAFVLFYRLLGEGWAAGHNVALADAQRAMRSIRSRTRDYGIYPERVSAMGFSAGGHVCGDLATRFDAPVYKPVDVASRPDAAALIYAVQSMTPQLAHPGSRDLLIGSGASDALAHPTVSNDRHRCATWGPDECPTSGLSLPFPSSAFTSHCCQKRSFPDRPDHPMVGTVWRNRAPAARK